MKLENIIDRIVQGDCIEILKSLPDNCVDLIFADPPYFMQSTDKILYRADGTGEFKGCDDEWDKYRDYDEYDHFCYEWLKECRRVLKKDGSIWVIGSFQNIYRIGYIMQNLGFWILNDIIWNKTNPTPNMSGTRFCNAHETLLWCSKAKNSPYTFNYKTMKYLNGNKQDRSVWKLGICQGIERLKGKDGKKLHSTQKPESLLDKIILSSTKPNDIILDPFFGTGTTGAVAKKYGRRFIGIEKETQYIQGATKRIENQQDISDDISNLSLEVKPPKVPLKELIAAGYLFPHQEMFDKNGNFVCCLNVDGTVYDGTETLSIHNMSAKALGKNSNNGWGYFYVIYNGKLTAINELRYLYKENQSDKQ